MDGVDDSVSVGFGVGVVCGEVVFCDFLGVFDRF